MDNAVTFTIPKTTLPRIVIIGGGFAGIKLAKTIAHKRFQTVLIDKHNYHTFQPLLYQVATGGLEPGSIAYPLRRVFKRTPNFHFRVGEVQEIRAEQKCVTTSIGKIYYDYLVIATGSTNNFFNLKDDADQFMPLKTVPEALNLRSILLQNMEKALLTQDEGLRKQFMSVVIVGAGPSGVELAGAISEMRKYVLPKDYPELDFSLMDVHLFEMADSVLPHMSDKSSANALKALQRFGVHVHLNTTITHYDGNYATADDGRQYRAETFIWAAGVKGAPPKGLRKEALVPGDRIRVDRFNRVEGFEDIFAIGDVAAMVTDETPKGHPMLAPMAMQQGKHLAKNLERMEADQLMEPFEYFDKGSMATIGRNNAVVDLKLKSFRGFPAWFIWMFVHILQLIGFRNKAIVFIDWVWNYFTYDRALRLIIRPYRRPGRTVITSEGPKDI